MKCCWWIFFHKFEYKPFDQYDWENDYPTEIVRVCSKCGKVKDKWKGFF